MLTKRRKQENPPAASKPLKSLVLFVSRGLLLFVFFTPLAPYARADQVTEGVRAYAAGNYSRAARFLSFPAERGDLRAQTCLGVVF